MLATHVNSGTPVAIKYLSEALRDEPGFLARFQEEARVMVELADPHVARLYEYRQTRYGGAAIVMELVNGVSLRAILREHGATGPEAALSVLKGSLLGLAAAHRLGVVHRDYKPENVLVQGDGTSKLVDFGIAVRSGDGRTPAGTPPYMAPEQWSGLAATPATDVYAATAVFFECLTGHRPYQATAHVVLKFQHEHAPVPIGEVPEPVRGLVARGLAKDPSTGRPGPRRSWPSWSGWRGRRTGRTGRSAGAGGWPSWRPCWCCCSRCTPRPRRRPRPRACSARCWDGRGGPCATTRPASPRGRGSWWWREARRRTCWPPTSRRPGAWTSWRRPRPTRPPRRRPRPPNRPPRRRSAPRPPPSRRSPSRLRRRRPPPPRRPSPRPPSPRPPRPRPPRR
ncbi:serine/threonine-protein kinase [Thermocatellispora tengchongensis]|uniref:serine/threonine-protein kinase n=1 Tax=Thermocatellispora tengchongensis TaxID=1073253 RepID=UPI00362B7F8A